MFVQTKTENKLDETRQLRASMNDLLSLLALPAMWSGRQPSQIIESLLDSLLGMLRLDFTYARLYDSHGTVPTEALRIMQRQNRHEPREVGQALEDCLAREPHASTLFVPNPVGEGNTNIARFPLGIQEKPGVLVAGSQRPDFPTEAEALLLRVAANQAAIALEGAQLVSQRKHAEEALSERARLAAFNAAVGLAVIQSDNLPEILQCCAEAIVSHLDAAFARIWILKPEEQVLELQASAGIYTHLDGSHSRVPVGKLKIGRIAEERKPHLTNSVIGDARVNDQEWAKREGMVAFAGYPLIVEDRLVGVVGMFARKPLSEATLDALASVVNAIALGIERKQAEIELREQTEVVETINRLGRTLSGELELHKLVQALTDAATELTGASFGSFFYNVSDGRGESLMLYTLSGVPQTAFAHFPMPRNTDLFGPTFRGEGIIRIADVKKDPRYGKNSPYYGMPPGHMAVTSYLAVPVISRSGEVLGGIFFGHPEAGAFTDRHERILSGLAAQAAIAIDNARLFELAQQERSEAEKAREEVGNILESITDSFSVYDREWRVTYFNKEAEKLLPRLGLTREEVMGKNLWEVFPDLAGSVVYQEFHRAVAEQVPVELELSYPPLDSWYELRAYPSKEGLAVYSQDITGRKQAEEALRSERARFEAVLQQLPEGVIIAEAPSGKLVLGNEQVGRIWGHEFIESDAVNKYETYKGFHPDGSPYLAHEWPLARTIQTGEVVNHEELKFQRGDGSFGWMVSRSAPIRNADGDIVAGVVTFTEITERKQMEQERERLLASEQAARADAERRWRESRLLAEATRRFSASLQLQDLLPTICQAAREIAEADGATIVLREGDQVLYAEEDAIAPLWKGRRFPITACISGWAILEHKPAIVEDIFTEQRLPTAAYESTFVKSLLMVPVSNQDPLGAIGVYWARKRKADKREVALLEALADAAHIALINTQLYEQTRASREQAEQANRLKDEFLATVSHELRTPLNAMLGWTRMLRVGNLDEQTHARALETIERNANSQAQLIGDLLDVSRIISGKMRLDVQPVELAPIIQAAVDSVRPAADAKAIRLNLVLDPNAGPVSGDPTRLQQIVWNLLSNAIKFTPKDGRVQVLLQRVDSQVGITVNDTGMGINPDFLPHVFERFRQADGTLTRLQSGLGLGLAIARHLVEIHGGNIHAHSAGEGKGASFTIKLPLMVAREAELDPSGHSAQKHSPPWREVPFECPAALDGLRVLVVDDEPDARQLLTTILERCNAEVAVVASAGEALQAVEALKPDILLSDIEMPHEDGYSLIRKVRARERGRAERIPAAALTAHAGVTDRMRALSAGFDIHIPKPVEPAELVAVIASLASRISKRPSSSD